MGRMSTTTVPHNLSILSMTKVNIGQIGGEKIVNSRCCRLLFIYDTFGETSVELEVGQPYSTEGPSEPGEGGCPQNFWKSSVNPVSIRRCGGAYHLLHFATPPPGILDPPTALLLITIFMALLLCQQRQRSTVCISDETNRSISLLKYASFD